ncbi:fumarylacetoacetate hydrolase family protein [Niabella drilacis]|uniref:Fumarylacetoacetate (FAA) hydrolase n=1 Tax=Niabella drilacis (strain DSM 25811 / CCM 8410 / CCUG 62505 / LMG 26954 / E90) TaxID=1285928 RepID=A0A1G6WXK9_NIADE|nr:fumarylacetoacetate hydrolase family protein [Niabella drilacis]SDD69917.1 fumarylacetoacetate (FAA) hydrolase [Niabella drilacis]
MRLISFLNEGKEQVGLLVEDYVYTVSSTFPVTMNLLLNDWGSYYPLLKEAGKKILAGRDTGMEKQPLSGVVLLAPVPHPVSCRDGYAFRQHVAAARRNRKAPMIPEFDQYPVFYFTNHNSIQGPGVVKCMPDHFRKLDFELEVAIVICRKGRNIRAADADTYIGGLMIMNDLSARTLQMEEMLLNLGPAKGKDFSTVIGPWLVTQDELASYETAPKTGHTGKSWNLAMRCFVNGKQVSSGNVSEMDWTFAELIERASYGADLYPGDVIGSGTVGTGCFLELNGTGKLEDPHYREQWLQPGDSVRMEIDGLGILENKIEKEDPEWSILGLKR